MDKLLIALPSIALLLVLLWRTVRVRSAHAKIAKLEARIADLESLIHDPIIRMDTRMKYKQQQDRLGQTG